MNRDSAAGRVAQGLRERVVSGALAPGSSLSQTAIAAEYGVSRIPVRDALQLLATDGLVDLQGTSAVVTPLSIEDLQELYELREAVEPLATRLAVPRVGRAEVARMVHLLGVMEDPATSPSDWIATNAAFHAVVYSLAGRPRTIALVDHLRRLTDRYVYFHLDVVGDVAHLQDEHRQILAAVRDQDARLAAELTRVHLVSSHDVVLRYLLRDDGSRT
ncbi:GntR family transcriptional regulator [Nocardioides mesophilus]|uniref:GntR family transcriptional regulator n=1 Tax=Nocardioides mesophilus TaxID=433659 RepID=A0A7G9RG60_9ACTN|nr:GntR family transcriptional regulator [Nocardioides mesophilus]QNN54585.1 GntR family transcriptional regulator [Nocardioides mesophilus]